MFSVFLLVFLHYFEWNERPTLESWAQFASYFNGVLSPVLLAVTSILIFLTWQSNQKELKELVDSSHTDRVHTLNFRRLDMLKEALERPLSKELLRLAVDYIYRNISKDPKRVAGLDEMVKNNSNLPRRILHNDPSQDKELLHKIIIFDIVEADRKLSNLRGCLDYYYHNEPRLTKELAAEKCLSEQPEHVVQNAWVGNLIVILIIEKSSNTQQERATLELFRNLYNSVSTYNSKLKEEFTLDIRSLIGKDIYKKLEFLEPDI